MAEPARKQTPDIEPDIRPSLRSIRGGGESTPDRANLRALNKQEEEGSSVGSNKPVDDQERNPSNVIKGPWEDKTSADDDNEPKGRSSFIKKKGPLAAIIMSVLVGGGGIGFFFTSALAPIAFFESIAGDLNDQLGALDIRSEYMARNKLHGSDKRQAIKGCGKMSIRCKFATVSEKQIRKLNKAGVKVEPGTVKWKGLLGSRSVPKSYTFQGKEYDAAGWAKQLDTNRQAKIAQIKANSMKRGGLSDKSFINGVLKRFNLSLKPPELKGKAQSRMNHLMNAAKITDAKNINFSKITNKNGKTVWVLDGDKRLNDDGTFKQTYTEKQKNQLEKAQKRTANAKPPSKLTKASVGALSVLGYWDVACSIKNMIGAAAITAKIANKAALVEFAMPIASLAGKMKAGDATPEEVETLGQFFMDTDNRKYIAEMSVADGNTNDEQLQATVSTNTDTSKQSNNPNYKKNAMDSGLYNMSSTGDVAPPSTSRSMYSLGMGQSQLLAGFSNAAEIASIIANVGVGGNVSCDVVQNGIVRGIGIIASVVIGVASFGTGTAIQVGVAVGLMAVMGILDSVLNGWVSGSIIDTDDLSDAPVERAAATWTGMSAIYGTAAQSRGLIPGNSSQLAQYQNDIQNPAKQDYIALESSEANPLDIYDQYSFLGSFARSMLGFTSSSVSGSSALSNIASIVSGGLSSIFKSPVYAATVDESRFKQCDDKGYEKIGIDPDVQCNVRYYMPSADLKMDTDDVAAYMEDNYVDAVTGLPSGYTPPQPAQSQGAAMDFLSGTVSQYIDTRHYENDYARFLDYCAYRSMPWGETFEENPSGTMRAWQTGEKCMRQGEPYNYFRIYTLDKTIQEIEDDVGVDSMSDESNTAAYYAKQIIDSGNVSAVVNDSDDQDGDKTEMDQIKAMVNGTASKECLIDTRLLKMIAGLSKNHTLVISDLNRTCSKSSIAYSSGGHYDSPSRAVDFDKIDGNGYPETNIALINEALSYIDSGNSVWVGQVKQRGSGRLNAPSGVKIFEFDDDAGHLHMAVD